MARYYFHVSAGERHVDRVGAELPSAEVAKGVARRLLGDLLQEKNPPLTNERELRIDVDNGHGSTLFSVYAGAIEAPSKMDRGH